MLKGYIYYNIMQPLLQVEEWWWALQCGCLVEETCEMSSEDLMRCLNQLAAGKWR